MNQGNFPPGMMVGQGMPAMAMQQNQMMAGVPPQQQQQQQQPQTAMNPTQLMAFYNNSQLQIQQREPGSWRSELSPTERIQYVTELASSFRLAQPSAPQSRIMQFVMSLENKHFAESMNKESYLASKRDTLSQLAAKRQENARGINLANTINQQGQVMPGGQRPNMTPGNTAFNSHLQHPMQASPLPGMTQDGQMAGGPGAQPMQQQLSNQPQQASAQQAQGQQPQRPATMPPQGQRPPGLAQQISPQQVDAYARTLLQNATPQQREIANQRLRQLPPEVQARIQAAGNADMYVWRQEASRRLNAMAQNSNQANAMQGQNWASQTVPQMVNQVRPTGNAVGQEYDMSQILGLQTKAIAEQNAGQPVVPASSNANMGQQFGMPVAMSGAQGPNQTVPGGQIPANLLQQRAHQPGALMNNQAAMNAQVMRMQNHQQMAQLANRNQALGMTNQVGAPPQTSMSLLTQPVGPATQTQTAGPSRPQSAIGMPMQQQNLGPGVMQPGMMQGQNQIPPSLLPHLPPQLRQQLLAMPREQFNTQIARFTQQIQQRIQQQQQRAGQLTPGQQQVGQGQTHMPGMPSQFSRPGPQQPGQPMPNQMPVGIGAGMPNGMVQNALNQPGQGQGQIPRSIQLQQQLLSNPQIIAQMDAMEFPLTIANANGLGSLPAHIKTYAQLKDFIKANPVFSNKIRMDAILNIQTRQFIERQNNRAAANAGLQGQMVRTPGAPGPQPVMGIGAPGQQPAPMAGGALRFPPNIDPKSIAVTPQEIARFRQAVPGHENRSNEEIRLFLQNKKLEGLRKRQAAQQAGLMQPNQGGLPLNQAQLPPGMTPPQPATQTPTQPKPAPQPASATQPAKQTSQQVPRKRPSSDDIADSVPAPAVQAPAMVASRSQQRPQSATPSQQDAKARSGQEAQAALSKRLNDLFGEVGNWVKTEYSMNALSVDASTRRQYLTLISQNGQMLKAYDGLLKQTFMMDQNEDEARNAMKDRLVLNQQINWKDLSIREPLFMTFKDFKEAVQRMDTTFRGWLSRRQSNPGTSSVATPASQSGQPVSHQSPAGSVSQSRKGDKPPSAPVAGPGQNPYTFNNTSPPVRNPAGTPIYPPNAGPPPTVHIPANKRAKHKPYSSPGQNSAPSMSPQVAKDPASDKRMAAATLDKMPNRLFKCENAACNGQLFESQEQLDGHTKQAHPSGPPPDPLKFVTESVAESFGLNPDGTVKASPKTLNKSKTAQSPPKPGQRGTKVKASPTVAGLKTPQQAKTPAPTSAPKTEFKDVKTESNAWANSFLSATEINETIKPLDNFTLDWVMRTDSSPSAMTPSSSRDSASSGSRESDISEGDNINVTVAVDPPIIDGLDSTLTFLEHWNVGAEDTLMETDPMLLQELGIIDNGKKPDIVSTSAILPMGDEMLDWNDLFTETADGHMAVDLSDWEGLFGKNAGLDPNNSAGLPSFDMNSWDQPDTVL